MKEVIEIHHYALYYFHRCDWIFNGSHTVDIEIAQDISLFILFVLMSPCIAVSSVTYGNRLPLIIISFICLNVFWQGQANRRQFFGQLQQTLLLVIFWWGLFLAKEIHLKVVTAGDCQFYFRGLRLTDFVCVYFFLYLCWIWAIKVARINIGKRRSHLISKVEWMSRNYRQQWKSMVIINNCFIH